jgi:hypothetical protein
MWPQDYLIESQGEKELNCEIFNEEIIIKNSFGLVQYVIKKSKLPGGEAREGFVMLPI